MDDAQQADKPEEPVSLAPGPAGPPPPPRYPGESPESREYMRLKTFLVIQGLFLVTSPLAGGFHYAMWSMLDTALFVLSIGIAALAFVVETPGSRRFVFRAAAVIYILGVIDMSANILLSGILGWRGTISPP